MTSSRLITSAVTLVLSKARSKAPGIRTSAYPFFFFLEEGHNTTHNRNPEIHQVSSAHMLEMGVSDVGVFFHECVQSVHYASKLGEHRYV